MNTLKWIQKNTESLKDKTVAISGATGGIGCELCRHLARLGASLILLDRNSEKSNNLIISLKREFPTLEALHIHLDLEDINSVKTAVQKLSEVWFDVLIFNAGAYSIPRKICDTGYNNIFQINFVSPYYMVKELLPLIKQRHSRVVAVGSIAHNYSKTDAADVDFSTRKAASKIYGNAKRFLMFSLFELFVKEKGLAITHPGITFTNITAHYPKLIFAVIKHPMKIIFMKPSAAALSILSGVFEDTGYFEWIGPRLFNVWGKPKKQMLKTCKRCESQQIFKLAEQIYQNVKNKN